MRAGEREQKMCALCLCTRKLLKQAENRTKLIKKKQWCETDGRCVKPLRNVEEKESRNNVAASLRPEQVMLRLNLNTEEEGAWVVWMSERDIEIQTRAKLCNKHNSSRETIRYLEPFKDVIRN